MKRKKRLFIYIIANAASTLLIPVFFVYKTLVSILPPLPPAIACFMHEVLKLYCGMCGGTRALDLLLHGDILGSAKANLMIPIFFLAFIALDIYLLIVILKDGNLVNAAMVIFISILILAVLLLIFFVVRNILLVKFGIDPLGDLISFYQ